MKRTPRTIAIGVAYFIGARPSGAKLRFDIEPDQAAAITKDSVAFTKEAIVGAIGEGFDQNSISTTR